MQAITLFRNIMANSYYLNFVECQETVFVANRHGDQFVRRLYHMYDNKM